MSSKIVQHVNCQTFIILILVAIILSSACNFSSSQKAYSQGLIQYKSKLGFTLTYPSSWTRQEDTNGCPPCIDVTFNNPSGDAMVQILTVGPGSTVYYSEPGMSIEEIGQQTVAAFSGTSPGYREGKADLTSGIYTHIFSYPQVDGLRTVYQVLFLIGDTLVIESYEASDSAFDVNFNDAKVILQSFHSYLITDYGALSKIQHEGTELNSEIANNIKPSCPIENWEKGLC